jgi:hypothetical protein
LTTAWTFWTLAAAPAWKNEPEPVPVPGADAVGAARPSGLVEDAVGLVHAELPRVAGGAAPVRGHEEVLRDPPAAPDQVVLDGRPVHQQVDRPAHRRIAQAGMGRADAGSLSLDLAPGVGLVALDVTDPGAGDADDAPLAPCSTRRRTSSSARR